MRVRPYTEKAFMADVVKLATLCGWRPFHVYDSRRCVAGYPDLHLVHAGRRMSVFWELKVGDNTPTAAQRAWLDDLRECGHATAVLYPEDWPSIETVLKGYQ